MKSGNSIGSQRRKTPNNNVINIRLNPNISENINLRDPVFLKVLEQEYAAKYLESMGVQANSKNISKILKQRPLSSCQIIESRMAGGLHTDTITIITKSEQNGNDNNNTNQTVSNEMLKILDLKKMALKKESKGVEKKVYVKTKKEKTAEEQSSEVLKYLDFNIKYIKNRYIFPFNETFARKNNFKMKDITTFDQDNEPQNLIFNQVIFRFPFTHIKLNLAALKELQTPINTKFSDIITFLQAFYQEFPQHIFPVSEGPPVNKDINKDQSSDKVRKKGYKKEVHILFQKKTIDKMFTLLRSDTNAKFIGVVLHLAYWSVFGVVNPIQVEVSTKKKMYLMIKQTMQYYQLETQNRKAWIDLVQPMVILTLKMALDYFFHEQYPKLFESEESVKAQANQIAFDKILLFIDNLLDQNNINGRFIFLESDIDGPKGNFTKDNKFIRKRIFGTSPALQMILPEPKDGKTRSIIAKNNMKQFKESKSGGSIPKTENQVLLTKKQKEEDHYSRQKLLYLALMKIRNRVEEFSGNSSLNPIITLDDGQ